MGCLESPLGVPKSGARRLPVRLSLRLFLMTVIHFRHFLGPQCRTGAGPELGTNLVPFWFHFGPQFDPNLVPIWSSLVPIWSQFGPSLVPIRSQFGPQFDPNLVPIWSQSGPIWSQFGPSLVPVWSQSGPSLVSFWTPLHPICWTVCYSCLVVVFMLEGGVGDTQNVGAVFMFSHWRGKLV